nr:hypothetical protein [Vibrio splendidus]MCC4883072.1 hypothetical protein [Vibrio splendidus]
MTKLEKALKILGYLGYISDREQWISYDENHYGGMCFKIKGIKESVIIESFKNITDSYREIARIVVCRGFNYGRCALIVLNEKNEIEAQDKTRDEFIKSFSFMNKFIIEAQEKIRIDRLSDKEIKEEITQKYGIKIINYERLSLK